MDKYVELRDVRKVYKMGEVEIAAADGINFHVGKGEFAVVVGASGAGKTTVLNILGGMDRATSGKVLVDGENIVKYNHRHLTAYRRDDIGFVFQFYNLVPNLTALENVELALQICKEPRDAKEVLEEVGLGDRINNFPAQLSGGEQQRVSIARALAKNPKLLLCDDHDGNGDHRLYRRCAGCYCHMAFVLPHQCHYPCFDGDRESECLSAAECGTDPCGNQYAADGICGHHSLPQRSKKRPCHCFANGITRTAPVPPAWYFG